MNEYDSRSAALRPDAILDPATWADAHRRMTTAETANPGPWRTSMTPYLREPLERLAAHDPCQRVVLMFPSQVGKTEVALNWLGYTIGASPCPIMLLQPTLSDAETLSKQRIKHLLESPSLAGLVSDPRARDSGNTLLLKEFPGGVVYLVGANSPAGLAGKPMGRLHADEPDRYPESAGTEGDPLELARKRLSSWGARGKELVTSTPTVAGRSRIAREYEASTQGRWEMPCPHCGTYQPLTWSGLRWTGLPGDGSEFRCWYECQSCKNEIPETAKGEMLEKGRWQHTHPRRKTWGGTMTALSAPVGGVQWRTMIAEWIAANAAADAGAPEMLKVFINTRLAQTWEDRGEAVDAGSLTTRAESWDPDALPEGIRVITIGVDVQDDRLECEVIGWGAGLESWSLAYLVIPTDPLDAGTWAALDDVRRRQWVFADGRKLHAACVCVDSGFRTQMVYDYARRHAKERVFAIKGGAGRGLVIWDKKVRKGGKDKNLGRFHRVGVDTAKDSIVAYLRVNLPGPGYCHFPAGRDPAYFDGLTAEKRTKSKDKRGRDVWTWQKRTGSTRNEALDCRVYGLAAMHCLLAAGLVLPAVSTAPIVAPSLEPMPPPPPAQTPIAVDKPIKTPQPIAKRPPKPKGSWWERQRQRAGG